jgi:nucleoside-diphosphate-sugar epimerase
MIGDVVKPGGLPPSGCTGRWRYSPTVPGKALILGGTGAVGRAAAGWLLASGWQVVLTGRDPAHCPAGITAAGGRFISADHGDPDLLLHVGDDPDLVVDCLCYTAEDATALLPLARAAGSTVMISTKAVYVDSAGNHANSAVRPRFDGPIRETQPTLPPGNGDPMTGEGYGPNKVAAERVLLDSSLPVTVLRPSMVHGAGARNPREWVFVKRVLDRRPAVFLANRGAGVTHTAAAANIAALIELAAARPGARILNAADPDAPDARRIARTIAEYLGHTWDELLLDGDGTLGRTPWDNPHPVVLDMTTATDLGYQPAGDFATTVRDEVDWLVRAARGGEDAGLLPGPAAPAFARFLDYAAEDRYLARQAADDRGIGTHRF